MWPCVSEQGDAQPVMVPRPLASEAIADTCYIVAVFLFE